MRASSTSSSASASVLLILLVVGGATTTTTAVVSAFVPRRPPPSAGFGVVGVEVGVYGGGGGGVGGRSRQRRRRLRRRIGLRMTSSSSSSSLSDQLSDQLSSLSYEGSFLGRTVAKLSNVASSAGVIGGGDASSSVPPAAATTTATSSSSSPLLLLRDDAMRALSSIASDASSSSAVSTWDDLASAIIRGYESIADVASSSDSFSGGGPWTYVGDGLGPTLDSLISRWTTTTAAASTVDGVPRLAVLLVASVLTTSVLGAMFNLGRRGGGGGATSPYPTNKYDPASARRYFDGKKSLVFGRAAQIAFLSSAYLLGLAYDGLSGNVEGNSRKRADELTALLAKLGPSFVKVGQSLSIRTDLLGPEYVRGLRALQDRCPPFDTSIARATIEDELGDKVEEIFVDFPDGPIAAASLGQVYRATTRSDGRVVAVKVQRPGIVEQIALDMHLIREVAGPLRKLFGLNTDIVGVVDAWGTGFVDELDYVEEAINAKSFSEGIMRTTLSGVVFAPPVVDGLTTRRVLTTEWIEGERLDRSAREDVSVLCSIAMNSYLTMMLETGLLHCDPHPGNLLRTTDGKLCILDWGMVTRINPDLQITLIEHMAHLTSADYEEVPKDLLLLGFIPESKSDLIKDSGVVETLAEIYGAWSGGGGAAAINVNKGDGTRVARVQMLLVPILCVSFSVLEGIGLSNDPKYSIINECLPYVSKRLLTDKSERTGGALSTFIFGPDKSNEDRIIDYDRVEQLVTGFGEYTTSASGELLGKNATRAEIIEGVATQVLDLLVTEEETPLQKIFVEQLAKIISSTTRSAWSQIRERSGILPSGRTVLGTLVDPLGVFKNSPIVRVDELDERTVETTRNLIQLLSSTGSRSESTVDLTTLSRGEITEITSIVAQKLFERRSGVAKTSNRLVTQLLQLTADRLEKGGGRDIVVVPSSDPVESINDGRIHDKVSTRENKTSDRLASARRILATIEQ
ncbi:hypothetical protein ACHAW5_010469 [Stephanodiscus triporus]|uniref:Protein kinase domain-containing protein n=1 Tax=Stephanodiscus triporus TaxID=2934178 RepID=A0ABD3P709_9STRA